MLFEGSVPSLQTATRICSTCCAACMLTCGTREKSRLPRETFDVLCRCRADLALRFSALWQSSRKDVRWAAIGHLELGVLPGQSTARVTPARYNHSLMSALRNAAGQGVRTPRQLLVGLHVAHRRGGRLRLSLRQRQALLSKRKGKLTAGSQAGPKQALVDTQATPICGYSFEFGEQYNYFCASRLG